MTVYINIKNDSGEVETIDEFETSREARAALKEYKYASDWYSPAYLSQRSTKEWRDK